MSLVAQGLEKTYGRRKVVKGVNLKVEQGEIVPYTGLEQVHTLSNHCDLLSQHRQVNVGDVHISEANVAASNIVESQEKPSQGRLSTACPSQQAQYIPAGKIEGEILQNGLGLDVSKGDIPEGQGKGAVRQGVAPARLDLGFDL